MGISMHHSITTTTTTPPTTTTLTLLTTTPTTATGTTTVPVRSEVIPLVSSISGTALISLKLEDNNEDRMERTGVSNSPGPYCASEFPRRYPFSETQE